MLWMPGRLTRPLSGLVLTVFRRVFHPQFRAASNNALPLPALFCATNRSCYWMKASAHWTGIPAPAVSMPSCLYVKTVAWPCCLSAMMIVTRPIWGVMCCRLIEQPLSSITDLFYPHVKGRVRIKEAPAIAHDATIFCQFFKERHKGAGIPAGCHQPFPRCDIRFYLKGA